MIDILGKIFVVMVLVLGGIGLIAVIAIIIAVGNGDI
jgi:hypothetical protein